ncbi:Protein CBG02080 [Caenorhabditis briggsae]|uniref:Protein CBG02080 n=1 Tax=Caenorhabditis briggsae TaxID=6238 RepID=A8WRY1_CAEBR|nr:Protein CBG02080 [Caenorhabditis briggsae]CAP23239.2 Protein CBG02080 [Caenorhabditis briggsae]
MSQETADGSLNSNRLKSMMNIIRRAFSFRDKRPTSQQGSSEETSGLVMEMETMAVNPTTPSSKNSNNKPRIDSLPTSDVPSTSASCSQPTPTSKRAPSIYEDPFVAVAADGTIYIKHYYNFHNRAEFQIQGVRHGHIRRNSRVVKVQSVTKIYYNAGSDTRDETVIKNWGICMNNVWWASHLNRLESNNRFTNVILICDGMHPGFSVSNIDAFAETLQFVGLPADSPFHNGIPSPPLGMLQIPFIDEDENDVVPKKRKQRRAQPKPEIKTHLE